jgi:acyl-CoA dehydrogenase
MGHNRAFQFIIVSRRYAVTAAIELHNEEANLFRDMIGRFCEAEVDPFYDQWERDEILPRDIWHKLGAAGFLCVDIPEAYGGAGSTFDMSMVIKGAGSDLQGVRTSARLDGDDWVINGSKTFITNGQHGDMVVTVARTDPNAPGSRGLSLFMVDTDKAGFSRGRNLEKLGLHAADTSELFYQDVRVPGTALLGELHRGFIALMEELPRERLAVAVGAVAAMEGALAMTVDYVKERQAFGAPLSKLQNTRFKIAEMQTEYRLNNAFVNECIDKYNAGELDAATASMAKFSTTEAQCRVVDGCLQLFGGYGYMREYPISRAYADARIQRIYGGTSEIMQELVARAVLDS